MKEKYPFVSIIVPVYNGENNIRNCIESLIDLDYPKEKTEIIVVDNNSKDNTSNIINEYPVIALTEKNIQSSYAARNTGIKKAKGEMIAFTDSDCIADKYWIRNAVKYFGEGNTGCVCGKIKGFSPSNYIEEYLINHGVLERGTTRFLPYPQTANAIYRRQVFEEIGLFEEYWVSGGDADLAWRMQLQSDFKMVQSDDVLVYHVHRSTIKGFFHQRITWGQGEVSLYKKYKRHYENKDGELIREYKEFARQFILKSLSIPYDKYILRKESAYLDKKLTLLAILGRRVGRIKGSVREKEFYI